MAETASKSSHRSPSHRTWVLLPIVGVLMVATYALTIRPPLQTRNVADEPVNESTVALTITEGFCRFQIDESGSPDDPVGSTIQLPAGSTLTMHVTSTDFVYALRQPELGLKFIAVPDLTSTVDVRGRQAGTFRLEIDPICGFPWRHRQAPGTIEVLP